MDFDLNPTAELRPTEPMPLIPRMGLRHIMLWMFFTAAIMACLMGNVIMGGAGLALGLAPLFTQFFFLVLAVGMGALFTAATTLLIACWRHQQIVMHAPGHWIAVALSLAFIWTGLTYMAYLATGQVALMHRAILLIGLSLASLLQAVVYAFAWRQQAGSRWRWLFGWAAVIELGIVLVYLTSFSLPWPVWAVFNYSKELITIAVLITSFVEALRGKPRDWAHLVSILGLFLISLNTYLKIVAFFFFMIR